MHNRLSKFLDSSNTLYPLQFGFRYNHSTETALLSCIENIHKVIDKGEIGCAIFMDRQKAFDTVDHEILLAKLEFYGIQRIALTWFKSFLSIRLQSVLVSEFKSNLMLINTTWSSPRFSFGTSSFSSLRK